MKNNSKTIVILLLMLSLTFLNGCYKSYRTNESGNESSKPKGSTNNNENNEKAKENQEDTSSDLISTKKPEKTEEYNIINTEGITVETRVLPPKGFERKGAEEKSFLKYMRNLTLKPNGSKVLFYNGSEKAEQSAHIAIFDFDIGDKDLQQCADSIIRVYSEYYWMNKEYEKISFHLTNGFLMDYKTWREGNRLNVQGNNVTWVKKAEYDNSYECFRKYLESLYCYAGTLSLASEGEDIIMDDVEAGDMFIEGGSPGHCVLIIDEAENEEGEKCYLLAQGYMPAQDFHILNNPAHNENPWYFEQELRFPIETPQWIFKEGSLKRWFKN